MPLATVSPKFQIVIPKEIRERWGLRPGQILALIDRGDIITIVPQRPLAEMRGMLEGAPVDGYRDETDRF